MARTREQERETPPPAPEGKKPISDVAPEDPDMSRTGTPDTRKDTGRQPAPTERRTSEEAPRQGARPGDEDIRTRAYQRYEARGRGEGQADEDWFEAEKEFQTRR